MFALERQSEIMAMLEARRSLQVQEAAAHFGVTEETVRRDLRELLRQGLIIRTHGGALLPDDRRMETPLHLREGINVRGKDAIGQAAAKLVGPGETVLLDASTSALFVARHLKNKPHITVITNGERIVMELADCQDIHIICTGGALRHQSRSYTGRAAENALSAYYADHLFFSCKGFSPATGLSDSSEPDSEMRKTMLSRARRRVFLCDHTKFDRVGYSATATLADIHTLITDVAPPEDWQDALRISGVTLLLATEKGAAPLEPERKGL